MLLKCFYFTLVIVARPVIGEVVNGIRFEDDFLPYALTEESNVAKVNISISKQFSFCAWYYLDWIRSTCEFTIVLRFFNIPKWVMGCGG